MRNIWTIAKREYNHYFISPLAYVVAFSILMPLGIYFAIIVFATSQQAFSGAPPPDITPITWLFCFLLVFTTPVLTMRLLSDEARMGTLELLLTAPIRDFELVFGKWLGAFLFILTILAITLVFPIILHFGLVSPGIDQKLFLSAYLGVILVAGAFLALGVGISAIFTNQFAAFFVTFGLFFFLWFMVSLPANLLPTGADVLNYLNMSSHFTDAFNRGDVKLSDLVYYISLIALGLFMGTTAIEIRRWR
ncbi:MAG: ABC transporter permease [Anaerolineae bacterium]|nr:ABC transporter permease [Anaerolineae bacterium]MCI0610473.1 ABC transporter permease [Anaerolineae bacterium]